jgi:hypothetical protein
VTRFAWLLFSKPFLRLVWGGNVVCGGNFNLCRRMRGGGPLKLGPELSPKEIWRRMMMMMTEGDLEDDDDDDEIMAF